MQVRCGHHGRVSVPAVLMTVALAVASLLLSPVVLEASSNRIVIDGDFSDWDAIEPVAVDAAGSNPGLIDFRRLWIANDERYLFVCLEFAQELNIQQDNQIKIYMDTDDDPATGLAVHGIGAELVWTLGSRSGVFRTPGGTYNIRHADIGFLSAPTVTSERFELALDRSSIPAASTPLFPGSSFRIVIEDIGGGDVIPDGTGGAAYEFDDTPLPPLPSLSMARHYESDLRIMTYNVLFDGFFEAGKKPSFARLLAALRPDIIGFEEIYDHSAIDTQTRVEAILPSSGQGSWYSAKAGPDIIAVSRYPITRSFTVRGNGAFLIDLRPTYDKDLLFVVAHTPCCSDESGRQEEIDAFMAFIRNARDPGGVLDLLPNTPIVIVGDMNLVGYRRQLETLLTGSIVNVGTYGPPFSPDWDGSDLEDANPRMTDLPLKITWSDPTSSFWPGKLDYIVYTGSVMDMRNTFIAYTPAMPSDTLTSYGLNAQDSRTASDHFPVVADFALPVTTAELDVHCLDVGWGNCTLIVSPTGGTFLLDAGADGKGEEVVAPYLDKLGISALDYICASNYNPQNIGGIDEVVDHIGIDSVRVAVLDRGYASAGGVYDSYAASVGAKRTAVSEGDTFDLGGGVTVTCVAVNGAGLLEPPFDAYDEADLSVALVVKYRGFDFFAAGDLPGVTSAGHTDIESTVASRVGDVDVYRVSEHGGAGSSNRNLVSTLLPEVAVIPAASSGPAGYPAQEVLDRLADYGAYVYQMEPGTGGSIREDRGRVVQGNVVLRVRDRTYVVNGSDEYPIEGDGVPISSLTANDAYGESLMLGLRVRVRGVATVATGTFATSDNDFFIQDATGGVNIFRQSTAEPVVHVGDKVEVDGFVDSFEGLTRITGPTIEIRANGLVVPEPVGLSTASVASGVPGLEGSLVELRRVYLAGGVWPSAASDASITVDDGTGACEVFIHRDTGIPGITDVPDTFNLVGILGQRDMSFPFLSGYRVMPRSRDDIRSAEDEGGLAKYGLVSKILPNPASDNLEIVFTRVSEAYSKQVTLYDVRGREVVHARAARGSLSWDWGLRDGSGHAVAGGIYFATVKAGGYEQKVKIVVMR
jgi:beta-lactamase superfamily II metal-dependent hydrolase